MPRLTSIFLVYFLGLGIAFGQPKYNHNWYFGDKAVMDFNTNPPAARTGSSMNTYRSASSISDPETGQLLFYTNGNSFWNRFNEMIDPSIQGGPVQDVIIIPLKNFKNRFIVFNFSYYFIIDMQARNGRGAILEKKVFALRTSVNRMTAVKHCLSEAYWLITINGNEFCSYLVHPDGRIDEPVISVNPSLQTSSALGDFISSNNGEKLALTCYVPADPVAGTFYEPQMFDFNKRCGTVSPGRTVLPMLPGWDMPHGIAFSPDDQLIYVAYGYIESQLVQYEVANPSSYFLAATSPQNFNQIACGPDGRLYITTHIDGIPSNKIDVVLNPNVKGSGCNYRENHMRLNGVTNFEVPNLIVCHQGTCQENKGYKLEVDPGACTNQPVNFRLTGQQSGIDSIKWFFDDPSSPGNYHTSFSTSYTYSIPRAYRPYLVMYFCNHADTFFFNTLITSPENFSLGGDTTLCSGDSLKIGHALSNSRYQWNSGDTSSFITIHKAGIYKLIIDRKGCQSSDTIDIRFHLPIELFLGDAYYICEEEKELVQLDAGKGFQTYLWHPTNDTTQWIEVGKQGNYYVVVRDFRGCKGNDASLVESRCDLRVFIPNAFSPNSDRLNDTFSISAYNSTVVQLNIYSAWGELIYEGPNGWDGTFNGEPVQQGIYLVKVQVSGFLNKHPIQRTYSNLVHLVY